MTKLEEVARAIYWDNRHSKWVGGDDSEESNPENWRVIVWEELEEHDRKIAMGAARAALEAMKNPTEEMIESACVADDHCTPPNVCESIFNAMIDRALEEK